MPDELTSVDDYRAFVIDRLPAPDPIELKSGDTLGLVLADDLTSDEPIPSFANSAMDGYALVAGDTATASADQPVRLRVTGTVPAGASELAPVRSGAAVRIMTGAPVPPGADAVVPVELAEERNGEVVLTRSASAGDHIRTIGQDVQVGQRLLAAGHRVRPADIGLMAAIGANRVRCFPPPRVVILSTGDELVPPSRQPGPGRIRDANGPMLAALVRQAGGVPYPAGIFRDDRKALTYAFDSNLGHADAIVASGGVSAGQFDLVRDVIGSLGEVWSFSVAMKPGKPQVFGRIGDVPVFGLPGNPVSSFVSFEVLVRPALRHMQGRRDLARPVVTAAVAEELRGSRHRRTYVRVRLRRDGGRWLAEPTGHQGSHVLTSVVRADGLAEIEPDIDRVPAGAEVRVHLLVDS